MTEADAKKLQDELDRSFAGTTEAEQIAPGRFRFAIVSSKFRNVGHLERQDQAWAVVKKTFSREQAFDISLLLTFDPDEVEVAPQS